MKFLCSVLSLALLLTACQASNDEVTVRSVNAVVEQPDADKTTEDAERFGYRAAQPAQQTSAINTVSSMDWVTPEGWTQAESTPTRNPNFIINGNDQAQCYVTVLKGTGGGALANINRWRQQLGLEAIDEAELALLDRITVLDKDGVYTDLEGNFSGMGTDDMSGARMLGAVVVGEQQSIFVKMIGPKAQLEGQEAAFASFVASLKVAPESKDPHAGMDMTGAMGGMGNMLPPSHPPLTPQEIEWIIPAAWTTGEKKPMRLATFYGGAEKGVEVSVIMLGGSASGIEGNVNRWYTQMGQDAPSTETLANLETIEVLETASPLAVIHGSFSGMGHEDLEDATMLALICPLKGKTLFVKAIGPTEQVLAQREAFTIFCQSMIWQQQE